MRLDIADGTFSFNILGPLEIIAAGTEITVAGARQQTLLTLLLLDVGKTITGARLIDGIWGGRAPQTAEVQLRICVSRLRRVLAEGGLPDVISTESQGYRLTVPEDRVDVRRFTARVDRAARAEAAGDDAEAVRLLRSALGLWRGPAAEGLTGPLVRAAAARLDEERMSALERCFGLELRLGRHHRIIPELMASAAEHPFRETLQSQLMRALYHAGRQADALNVYRDVKRRFAEELGIDPSQRLRALEQRILEQHPELGGHKTALPQDAHIRLAALERENASLRAERKQIDHLMVRLMRRHDLRVRS
ncbi:BTAD domain-containing putative transcriptional regulator [Streptomyces sp. NPDC127190]|uniref:AfsR/SARP family transcriptional regulator n=1 Tax=unclassified Streptomyces TaxID=2593676 RepID=UPI00363C5CA2